MRRERSDERGGECGEEKVGRGEEIIFVPRNRIFQCDTQIHNFKIQKITLPKMTSKQEHVIAFKIK